MDDPEVQLAISRLPVIQQMQTDIGGILYSANVDSSTDGPNPTVSVENNVSMLAGLRILRKILSQFPSSTQTIQTITQIETGILMFFKNYAYDQGAGIFLQGGAIINGQIQPDTTFAVDCQTWLMTVLGKDQVDEWFGTGCAYQVWQKTKQRSGVNACDGKLQGIGYTDGHGVISSEWSLGAVNMCRVLANQYEASHPQYASSLRTDAESMLHAMELLKIQLADKSEAYNYASTRYYIPFGWWANPVPCTTATACKHCAMNRMP